MRIARKVGVGLLAMLLGTAAHATIISSINMEVRDSTYSVLGTDDPTSLLAEFASGGLVCDVSLDALSLVGSSQTCGGPTTNIATLFSIDITQSGVVLFEFGADWGRGGIAFLTGGTGDEYGPYTPADNLWWALDWNNSDVIGFGVPASGSYSGSYTLNLLGFEGCCGGAMSLRYSDDGGGTWQMAAVNAIPEPSTLALLGLGLLGLGLVSRRKA